MSELTYFSAAVLGVIQGLTEFLPISSSAHLALAQGWLRLDPGGSQMLLFDVFVHVGTVAAVVLVFRKSLGRWLGRLVRESRPGWSGRKYAWYIVELSVAATVLTAIIGLRFKGEFEAAFARPKWIGGALLVTAILLMLTKVAGRQRRGWRSFYRWQAALVGVVQACAIMPGISRSGATICVAGFCGLRRRWAAEFSFLIAVPAILGATGMKWLETMELSAGEAARVPWGPTLLGSLVAFVVGVVALKALLATVRRAKLHYFAPYCALLGALLLSGVL